jgi:TolA-binding protein
MFTEAKKYFSDALNLKPNLNDIQNRLHLGLGVANYFLKNYNDAEKNFEELKKTDKNFETDKVNFYLAEVYYAQGKYIAALKNYNSIKSTDKLITKQTLLGKAYSYFNSKEFSNAINFFEDFINRYPNDKNIDEIKLRLADSYFGAKRFDKAASLYKEIMNENKNLNNDLAYYQFAQALFKAGKSEDAKNAFQDLQIKFPKSKYIDESQYVIGWIAFQQNKFDEAINSYKQLIAKYPNSELRPIAEYSIGDSYFNKASYDSAIYYYSKVIDNYPNSQFIFDAVNGIQYSYVAKDQPQNAISFIDDFISSHPSSKFSDQIYFKKGDLFYSLEKFNDAVVAYKDFISKYPKSSLVPNAYYWIGKSYSNLKKFTEAIPNFSSARSISPKSDIGISSTVELVEIYQQKNQLDDALKILEETIASNSTSNRIPELLFLQGVVENKANKTDDAVSTFDQIATYYNGSLYSAKAKVELGKIEISRNNFDKAQSYLREVAENRLDDIGAQAQYYYGISFFNQNKIEDAITQFVRTRSVFSAYDEWYTKSLLRLGDCFIKMNDKKQAREMFRAVLIRHTNDSFADEAKKKMKGL